MKVSDLIVKLLKVKQNLDVYIQVDLPANNDAHGLIDLVNVVEVISAKDITGEWQEKGVVLRCESGDDDGCE